MDRAGNDVPPHDLVDQRGGPVGGRPVVLTAILVILSFGALRVAQPVFFPVALALLLYFLLRPAVRWLTRRRVPVVIAAALAIAVPAATVSWGVVTLWRPALKWVDKAPRALRSLDQRSGTLKGPVEKVSEAAEEVEKIAEVDGSRTPEVNVRERSLGEVLAAGVTAFVVQGAMTMVLLFFFLAFGDNLLRSVVRILPAFRDKRRAVEVARHVEVHVSRYLAIVTSINVVLAAVVGVAMKLMGMPNPWLWGVLAGLVNYVPYLGPTVGLVVISLVSAVAFPDLGRAVLAPLVYFTITATEGSFVTPMILGRHHSLNPLVILIWLLLWGWMWGVGGAVIAVPLLVTFKLLCDHIGPLQPLGELIGRRAATGYTL